MAKKSKHNAWKQQIRSEVASALDSRATRDEHQTPARTDDARKTSVRTTVSEEPAPSADDRLTLVAVSHDLRRIGLVTVGLILALVLIVIIDQKTAWLDRSAEQVAGWFSSSEAAQSPLPSADETSPAEDPGASTGQSESAAAE